MRALGGGGLASANRVASASHGTAREALLADSLLVERLLRRDRLIVVSALGLVVLIAAAYTVVRPGMAPTPSGVAGMDEMAMTMTPSAWSAGYAVIMFLMWWIMMVAMMVPSASPMVLLYAAIQRKQAAADPVLAPAVFLSGYLAVWGVFSLAATLLQWRLEWATLISPVTLTAGKALGGAILIAAGLYQLTPVKYACLKGCREPARLISEHWASGNAGAFRMGVVRGAYCLGCCWFLMLLLFVGGVMNLVWIAGIAVYVLAEKTLPAGRWVANGAGVGLVAIGATLLGGLI
ncbi:MAG: DUF2182 domain-containing protein [Bauldia sp.]